jgi:hypothetical protein
VTRGDGTSPRGSAAVPSSSTAAASAAITKGFETRPATAAGVKPLASSRLVPATPPFACFALPLCCASVDAPAVPPPGVAAWSFAPCLALDGCKRVADCCCDETADPAEFEAEAVGPPDCPAPPGGDPGDGPPECGVDEVPPDVVVGEGAGGFGCVGVGVEVVGNGGVVTVGSGGVVTVGSGGAVTDTVGVVIVGEGSTSARAIRAPNPAANVVATNAVSRSTLPAPITCVTPFRRFWLRSE